MGHPAPASTATLKYTPKYTSKCTSVTFGTSETIDEGQRASED
jgi:hypothetical protein